MNDEKRRDSTRLSNALSTFAATARYNMLKTLQVGRFVENGPADIGVLSEYTFEKLIELGSRKISKLRWLTQAQEERLLTLLEALSDGEELPLSPAPLQISRAARSQVQPEDEDEIGSVKIELDLRERLSSLRTHPEFERVKGKTLGQFWDPTWTPAPFEEAFTIEQLAQMDLSMLFKKRSMTNRRVRFMSEALARALASLQGEAARGESQKQDPQHSTLPREDAERKVSRPLREVHRAEPHRWEQELEELSTGTLSVLEAAGAHQLLLVCDALSESERPFERFLGSFPEAFSVCDLVEILGDDELSSQLRVRLSGWLAASPEAGRGVAALREALRGPGAHVVSLVQTLPGIAPLPLVLQRSLCQIVIRALGAQRVRVGRDELRDIWTLNPKLLSLILKEVKRHRTLRPIDVLSTISPELDQFLLNMVIESLGSRSDVSITVRKTSESQQQRGKKRAAHGTVKV